MTTMTQSSLAKFSSVTVLAALACGAGSGARVGDYPSTVLSLNPVVAVFDGTADYYYFDGVLDRTITKADYSGATIRGQTIRLTTAKASIGENTDANGRVWDGKIAEVAIFSYGLSAAQIRQFYQAAGRPASIVLQPSIRALDRGNGRHCPVLPGRTLGRDGILPRQDVREEKA
jgi:hypothetical protein